MESARVIRRAAKGKMTRQVKTVQRYMSEGQSGEEVQAVLHTVKTVYMDLTEKHEQYCSQLTDDLLNDTEEEWMDICHNEMINLEIAVNNYVRRSTLISKTRTDKEKEVSLVAQNLAYSRGEAELSTHTVGEREVPSPNMCDKAIVIQNEYGYGGHTSNSEHVHDNTQSATFVDNMQPHVVTTTDGISRTWRPIDNVQNVTSSQAFGDISTSLPTYHSENSCTPSTNFAYLPSSLPASNTQMVSSFYPTDSMHGTLSQSPYNAAQMSSSLPVCNSHIPSPYPTFSAHTPLSLQHANTQVSLSWPPHIPQIEPVPICTSQITPSQSVYDNQMSYPAYSAQRSSSLPASNGHVSSSLPTHNVQILPSLPDHSSHTTQAVPINNASFTFLPPVSNAQVGQLPRSTVFQERNVDNNAFNVKREFIPKFSGDVREYGIFRADFKHIVEKNCSGRDAITLLRSSLTGKAAEIIRGITTDYTAAWAYLDAVYGDPRYVADAVTHDISSFPTLRSNEDSRFCDFVHLLRRSYNTLNELGCSQDMNNNHILALIEQKLCNEDRKVWSRDLQRERKPATFHILLDWLTNEMTARMRSSATLRNSVQSNQRVNHVIAENVNMSHSEEMGRDKCWICQTTDHWIDQCDHLKQLSPTERLQKIQENHACFCCLKKAGRNHTSATCYRRRQCTENVGSERCKMFHHALLHGANHNSAVGVASLSANGAMLPVVSVKAIGTHGRQVVSTAMLDTGAQISLIRNDLAEKLGLDGMHVTITLNKVGGQIQAMHTKVYEIRIQPLDQNHAYTVSVIGIQIISEEISHIQEIDDIGRMFHIPRGQLRRGHGNVDILIGIDNPKMHIGETREKNNIVARHSPLGWLVFGSPRDSTTARSVLHVAMARPSDLTESSTTNSIGVSAIDCHDSQRATEGEIIQDECTELVNQRETGYHSKHDPRDLLDNKLQASNRLIPTEKGSTKEYATSYSTQIKERENLNILPKLTDVKIKGSGEVVHNIANRDDALPESTGRPAPSTTASKKWRHISRPQDVADDVSRRINPSTLKEWPNTNKETIDTDKSVNKLKIKEDVIKSRYFLDWKRLIRVMTYIFLIMHNMEWTINTSKLKDAQRDTPNCELITSNMGASGVLWMTQAHIGLNEHIGKRQQKGLSPSVGPEGEICVGGRDRTHVSYDHRQPILISIKHRIATSITWYLYQLGVASTGAKVQHTYSITKVHKVKKPVISRCIPSERINAITERQLVDLPLQWLTRHSQYIVKVVHNQSMKHYPVLFACLNTRVARLKMTVFYATHELLQALRRFCTVRDQSTTIIFDNNSRRAIVGREKESLMVRELGKATLRRFPADRQMEACLTTPLSLQCIGTVLMHMELYTYQLEAANLIYRVNHNDSDDDGYSSPNGTLLSQLSSEMPQGLFRCTTNLKQLKRHTEAHNVSEDDVVIVAGPNVLRGQSSTERVTDAYPGPDGKVRSMNVKYMGPITKIVVIHPAKGYELCHNAAPGGCSLDVILTYQPQNCPWK